MGQQKKSFDLNPSSPSLCFGVSPKKVFVNAREFLNHRKKTSSVEPKITVEMTELE